MNIYYANQFIKNEQLELVGEGYKNVDNHSYKYFCYKFSKIPIVGTIVGKIYVNGETIECFDSIGLNKEVSFNITNKTNYRIYVSFDHKIGLLRIEINAKICHCVEAICSYEYTMECEEIKANSNSSIKGIQKQLADLFFSSNSNSEREQLLRVIGELDKIINANDIAKRNLSSYI
jgi:hypothetical protein